jgi:hypothetical protein
MQKLFIYGVKIKSQHERVKISDAWTAVYKEVLSLVKIKILLPTSENSAYICPGSTYLSSSPAAKVEIIMNIVGVACSFMQKCSVGHCSSVVRVLGLQGRDLGLNRSGDQFPSLHQTLIFRT